MFRSLCIIVLFLLPNAVNIVKADDTEDQANAITGIVWANIKKDEATEVKNDCEELQPLVISARDFAIQSKENGINHLMSIGYTENQARDFFEYADGLLTSGNDELYIADARISDAENKYNIASADLSSAQSLYNMGYYTASYSISGTSHDGFIDAIAYYFSAVTHLNSAGAYYMQAKELYDDALTLQ